MAKYSKYSDELAEAVREFLMALFGFYLALQLTGVVALGWLVVLSPLWVPPALALSSMILVIILNMFIK